jgi:hypothetical protein
LVAGKQILQLHCIDTGHRHRGQHTENGESKEGKNYPSAQRPIRKHHFYFLESGVHVVFRLFF